VIVFTARPGRVKADIRLPNLDRSGDYRKSREYLALRVEVWDLVRDEVLKARALEEAGDSTRVRSRIGFCRSRRCWLGKFAVAPGRCRAICRRRARSSRRCGNSR